jgi:3-hydroxyisobutyrate dehydrogenase
MGRIGFIGLGRMGLGMARQLLQAGHALRVYNRTRSKARALGPAAVQVCATPREACERVDAVVAMVSDDEASRAIWLGPDGVLAAHLAPRALTIECSTLSYAWVRELAAEAARRDLRYIDSPVTGLPEDAAAGALTLLVGADPSHLEAARALLSAVSTRILRFGGVGAGTAYKLIINMMGAVQIASLAEGLAIAERAGLDLAVVTEAIATGQAASPQVVRNAGRMLEDDHDREVVFTPALRLKDVDYALKFARSLGVGSPFGQLAGHQLRQLCELGHPGANESKIIEVARIQTPDA